MTDTRHILAIDQGTTSSRAIVFDGRGRIVADAQKELPQHFPRSGWVEHDPEDIWRDTLETARGAMEKAGLAAGDIAGIGITNQRETAVIWDRETGKPVHNAIVWQDRRGAPLCDKLRKDGHEALIQRRTGLLVDSYFSATKIAWILENVDGARQRAEAGKLAFGTVDSFLLWRLTGGTVHATDATNASRTMLYDIRRQRWDDELLALLDIPAAMLPEVRACDAEFGHTQADLFGASLPVTGIAGDQQAAVVGQACFDENMLKSTYGTGCFALMNTGRTAPTSRNRLLTTIAYRLGEETTYALEGSIFVAGAAVQWLRDGLKLLGSAPETETLAQQADPESGVYMVPAFVGLGAPYWDSGARGAIFGLNRATGPAEIAAATLDAVCYQTRDLLQAMEADGGEAPAALRVDGGMVANDWFLQRLADLLNVPVERPEVIETTALGAACLAGLKTGVFDGTAGISEVWRAERRFEPRMHAEERERRYAGWVDAVRRVRSDG
ncbi:glycerol kinase GlpK [Ferruginivarius sediminum]|uniref:Glycerol kinase n=1 Tax=Ferruginivarius sediminum TaxID=2661937 RepID=A0A369TDV9_9PROT|nr:glycerol kinase GlpK [Ferruginivarius sediminum]RDD63460.1 glycerol kinase [Ferruginivarius sediminum]